MTDPHRPAPARRARRFDATWLPFGMMLGFIVGVGIGLSVVDQLFLGAGIGALIGLGVAVVLGFRVRDGATRDEDAEDDAYRAAHGDPAPRPYDER